LGWFFGKICINSFKKYQGIYANLQFQNASLYRVSRPKFHSMVQVIHRCILLEVASGTCDEPRLDANESNKSSLYFGFVPQLLLNKNQIIINIVFLFIKVGNFKHIQN